MTNSFQPCQRNPTDHSNPNSQTLYNLPVTKTLYFLRHASIPENELGINGSRTDSPLSEKGIKEAKELVTALSKHNYDLIIVSPLRRTRQTIQPYFDSLKQRPTALVDQLTIERDLGDFTNTRSGDGKIPADISAQGKDKTAWQPKGGESTVQVGYRAQQFLEEIKKRKEKSVLICAHQNFLRCLELIIRGEPIDDEHFFSESPPRLKPGEIRVYSLSTTDQNH